MVSLFILLCSINSKASYIDGGEIRFQGLVTDNMPKWSWRVSSPEQFWDVDIRDARKEGDELIFNLKNRRTIPFIEGHLYEVASHGGANLTPYVTYSSGKQPLFSIDGGNTTRQLFRASIPVWDLDKNKKAGSLEFTIEQALAITSRVQKENSLLTKGMFLVSGENISEVNPDRLSPELLNTLSELLMMNKNYGNEMSVTKQSKVIPQRIILDGRVKNIAAAFSSVLSDFELHFQPEMVPRRWHATLNVTIEVH